MNIIIFLNKRKKGLRLSFGSLGCTVGLIGVVALVAISSVTAYRYMEKDSIRNEIHVLQGVKNNTEISLNTMASRLSVLQSHVMRLNALGSRLADMAELDDIEFGIEHPPGVGGPHIVSGGRAQRLSDFDFLLSLNRLEQSLQGLQDKLSAMETLLMGRSLHDQVSPLGNPAQGGWLSSLFGYRPDPVSGRKEFHLGVDIAGKYGLPVTSVASGIVTWSDPSHGYGNLIEINHGNGYVTRYAHNRKNLVTVGEKVEKGAVIATMGSSGRSTGPHVHFEVVRNGKHVDPNRYISLQ